MGPYEVDFLWRAQRLIVEADSFRYHGTRHAFEADRQRDVRLKIMGFTCTRFTSRQLVDHAGFATTLRALLEAAA